MAVLFFFETVFTDAAERAFEIFGQVFPFGSGGYAVVGIAGGFVVNIAAYCANIFFYKWVSFNR